MAVAGGGTVDRKKWGGDRRNFVCGWRMASVVCGLEERFVSRRACFPAAGGRMGRETRGGADG